MNPKHANKGDPCAPSIRRGKRGLWAIIIAMLTQSAAVQAQVVASPDRISIDYGVVTQHYQTIWSDPTLPAGVARGMPPSAMSSVSENEGGLPMPTDAINDADSTETEDTTSEAAVLFVIDLGENGVTMVVSTKTSLQPGDCAAIERSGSYFNLRGVNKGFCDPANQIAITRLQGHHAAAAQHCKEARERLATLDFVDSRAPTPGEIGILCDGS